MHSFFDGTKSAWADHRHRAILHNTYGIFLLETIFGQRERIRQLEQQVRLMSSDDDPSTHSPLIQGIPVPTYITRASDGHVVPIRAIGEQHVEEDLGRIPTIENWLDTLPRERWHGRLAKALSKEVEDGTE